MTSTVEPIADTDADTTTAGGPRPPRRTAGRRPRAGARAVPVVGQLPGVDLLPREVHIDRRERIAVRRAWLGVVVVTVAVALGVGAATATALSTRSELTAAEGETTALLGQQGQYSEVRAAEAQSRLLESAQKVAGSTEIDWSTYLKSVQASLPSNVTITSVAVDSSSPVADFAQATGPLQGQRVATLSIVATSPTLPSVPDWLDSLRSLTGYVDASAESVTLATDDGADGYTVNMTIHVNEKAYDGRYSTGAK